jgi:single-strand DNA-binding protein
MASFNRVILLGNLTKDVELRHIQSTGSAVTDISLAVNERVKRNDQWVDEVHFFDVTLWGRTAEVASMYLSKGSPVLIEGKLRLEKWEQDGQKRSKVKIVGERMQLLGSKNAPAGGGPHNPATPIQIAGDSEDGGSYVPQGPPPEDEVPF